MCGIEGAMLQRGMNFRLRNGMSVILMSRRRGAPYHDEVLDNGTILVYEGHDVPKGNGIEDPKKLDQTSQSPSGKASQNGKFLHAAKAFKSGHQAAELVRVYEKIKEGIWVYNGIFKLIDAWQERAGTRKVYKFKLSITDSNATSISTDETEILHTRLIPSSVKVEVYKRDNGQCVLCGSKENLHFDHDLPYSKGGTSLKAANIRLLCARHNIAKRANIE